jgi:FHS family glucose/mannose:H+ symporter-like MFS transporter
MYMTTGMLGMYATLYQYTILSIAQGFAVYALVMGAMIGVQYFGMSVPPLFIGPAGARFGKKKLMLASCLLIAAGALLVSLAHHIAVFIIAAFIIGAGFSVTEATASAVLSDEFPEASRRHLNFSQVAFSMGALAGPLIAEALINRGVPYLRLYLYCGGIFLLLALLLAFTRPQNDKGSASAEKPSFIKLLGNRFLLLLALGICLYVGFETTIANYADSYYELSLGQPALSALALALFWGAMIPSRFAAGLIKTETGKIITALSALLVVSIIAAMFVPNIPLLPGFGLKHVFFALAGFACGPMWPLMMDSAAQRSRGASGASLGVMLAFSGLGGALLPLFSGIFVNLSDPSAAYYISAATVVVMAAMFFLSRRVKDKA